MRVDQSRNDKTVGDVDRLGFVGTFALGYERRDAPVLDKNPDPLEAFVSDDNPTASKELPALGHGDGTRCRAESRAPDGQGRVTWRGQLIATSKTRASVAGRNERSKISEASESRSSAEKMA